MLQQVLKTIRERERFVLTSHARPDGDAIGSVLAARELVCAMGKQADIVMRDPVPVFYRDLPQAGLVKQAESVSGDYDAAIILECDGLPRTGLSGLDAPGRVLVNIDHHGSAKPFAHVNWTDAKACATAQMIFDLAKAAGVRVSAAMATCLYTALLSDTGGFRYQSTNEKTFALAQELVRAGADAAHISQHLFFNNPEAKMRLLGAALSSLKRKDDVAWMLVTQAQMKLAGAIDEDCEGLVNYALSIQGVEVALFFRELAGEKFRVSLRSKGAVNVARLAEHFGGGGHDVASGCSLDGPLSVACERIMEELARVRSAGGKIERTA